MCGITFLLWKNMHQSISAQVSLASINQYSCTNDKSSMACYEQHYKDLTLSKGTQAAFTALKTAYISDPLTKSYCHQITHVIGRTEADSLNDVSLAYAQGDNFCWSGYYHGVMESIVTKIGSNNIINALPNICTAIKLKKRYSFDHFNCVHGLGHGIMDITASNLFSSLKLCDSLQDSWEQQSCYGGVFMENEMDEVNPSHSTKYLSATDPMYPCTAVDTKYKEQCYLMQTSHALRISNEDFSLVFSECGKIESLYQNTCYQSLGRDASGNSNSDVDQTKAHCLLGTTYTAQSNCIVGAIKDFISYYHSDTQASMLCNAFDQTLQDICNATKTQYYSTL